MKKIWRKLGTLCLLLGLFFAMSLTGSAAADDIAGGVIDEEYGQITWRIDKNGHLTVEGWGDLSDPNDMTGQYWNRWILRVPWLEYKEQIKSAKISVDRMKNASYLFCECKNIINIDLKGFHSETVTNMRSIFSGCEKLETLDLSHLDTSNVEDMISMFMNCKSLGELDVSNFDTSNVKYMSSMFYKCEKLRTLDLSNFDTSNVETMIGMFYKCLSLEKLDISNLDTGNVKDMNSMFYKCASLKTIDLSNFNTSNVTDMSELFGGCSSLEKIDVSNFDTRKVKIIYGMFDGCKNLKFLDLSSFKTDSLQHTGNVLRGCNSLEKIIPLVEQELWVDLPRQYATQRWYAYDIILIQDLNQKWPEGAVITKSEVYGLRDVFVGEWFTPYVQYVFKKGLMNGYDCFFTPNESMSRAMVVQTLYNMENRPEVTDYRACEELKDIHQDWYTDAVCWAYNEGITTGYDDTKTFKVDEPVTREQLATFFYRYAQWKGYDCTQQGSLGGLRNSNEVSFYAEEAVQWAVGTKLISGVELKDSYGNLIGRDLAPQGNATRGQMAAILQRFCESYKMVFPDKTVYIPENAFEWNGHYYAVFANCLSWERANAYCESRGGHLATITSPEENEAVYFFIKENGYTSAYFGLSDKAEEGTWTWVTGEEAAYTNWSELEPSGGADENYAMFFYLYEDGTWNDGAFLENVYDGGNAYICEWE